jgi:hypothetical protein
MPQQRHGGGSLTPQSFPTLPESKPRNTSIDPTSSQRYARCIEVSQRVRWDIERDVIRGRSFDDTQKFLPDGLSRVDRLQFLRMPEQRLLSRIQGRTYANMFGLVERFIGAKMLELSRDHWLGDQVALEAIVRFTDEELKHQALFRRVEQMIAQDMPEGYHFGADPNAVASAVLAASTWAVLALTCHIELFTQVHYRQSIEPQAELSEIFKDIFLFHWKEESQHAIIDELEWRRVDATLDAAARDRGVDDLIVLIGAVDGIVREQSAADGRYFLSLLDRSLSDDEQTQVSQGLLAAYRWQYIVSGAIDPRFNEVLSSLITPAQGERIRLALAPLLV